MVDKFRKIISAIKFHLAYYYKKRLLPKKKKNRTNLFIFFIFTINSYTKKTFRFFLLIDYFITSLRVIHVLVLFVNNTHFILSAHNQT